MKKLSIVLLSLLIPALLCSCGLSKDKKTTSLDAGNHVKTEEGSKENEKKEPVMYSFAYTGEKTEKDPSNNISFMAIIENSKDARPQSGLSEADIVFETMAEGGIPRFIALFNKNSPKEIGPIRSVRPYFIDIAKEYNTAFAHCGGSDDAIKIINSENLMSMNEMSYGKYYWRDKSRKAPHNLYTSSEKLRSLISSKGYVKNQNVKLNFDQNYWENSELKSASSVALKLNKFYNTSYKFENGAYTKYINGEVLKDKSNGSEVTFKNVVITKTPITLTKDNVHINVPLTGEGEGLLLSNGKYQKIKWSKKDKNSQTQLKDSEGKEVPFSPGNTCWNIIDRNNVVEIK